MTLVLIKTLCDKAALGSLKMPRNYKRKTERYQFEHLKRAVLDVRNKRLKLSDASRIYSVPKSTIYGHLKEEIITQTGRGHKCTFTEAQEKRLEEHILACHQLFKVLTANAVRKIAFKFAKAYKVKNTFDRTSKTAGKDWYYGFMKRHPNIIVLSTKKLASSGDGGKAYNEAKVMQFFDNRIAQEIIHHVDNTESQNKDAKKSKRERENDEGQGIGINGSKHRRNTVDRRDGEITNGDALKNDLKEIAPDLCKIEKNNSALRELQMQLLNQRTKKIYGPYSRIKKQKAERFRNVDSEPEVILTAEVVETSDPLEALAVPGPSRYNIYKSYDNTAQDNKLNVTSEIARKDPYHQLSTSSLDCEIKVENPDQDSTKTPEETLADFSVVSQDEVSEGDISSDDNIMLSHFHSEAESNSESSVYFRARSIQKTKQKVTTEILFHRYKLKSKREMDRLHNKIRELKASVAKYKRQVCRLKQQRDNVTGK